MIIRMYVFDTPNEAQNEGLEYDPSIEKLTSFYEGSKYYVFIAQRSKR